MHRFSAVFMFFLYKSNRRVLQIEVPPLSLSGFSPTTQLGAFLYYSNRCSRGRQDAIDFVAIASSLRATNGRRAVGNTNRLKAVPLRLRGGFATECHAFSYKPSSSALIGSPPCGSCSVYERAHTVNKYASNECPLEVRSARRADGGFYLVFEGTHSVNKYTLNKCSFIRLRAQHALTKQALARNCGLSFASLILRVKMACAVSDCENKCGLCQSPQRF